MCIYPWRHVSPVNSPFVEVFNNVGIPFAADIINFVVLTAAASACNSSIFSTGRLLFSLTLNGKSQSAQWTAKLSRRQVPARAILVSTGVIAVAVVLNLFLPGSVFTLVSSMATISFLFVWGMIMLAHLRYTKLHPPSTDFRMPLYPFADYLVLGFLLLTAVIMMFDRAMLSALIFAIVWIATLFILRRLRRAEKAA